MTAGSGPIFKQIDELVDPDVGGLDFWFENYGGKARPRRSRAFRARLDAARDPRTSSRQGGQRAGRRIGLGLRAGFSESDQVEG